MTESNAIPPTPNWNKCSVCKKPLGFNATYYKCSVSTCNRVRFQLYFCSMGCWDAHLPGARHRSAYAIEHKAPSQ